MWWSVTKKRHLISFGLLALVLLCPYALPAPWHTILSLPGTTHYFSNPVDNQQWYIIFGAVALLFLYGFNLHPASAVTKTPTIMVAMLWFTYSHLRAVTLPAADFPEQEMLLQAAFGVVFVLTATSGPPLVHLIRFQLLAAMAVIPLAILAISQKLGHDPLNYSQIIPGTKEIAAGKLLVASTFGHPNYMGSYLAPVFVLTLGLLSRHNGIFIRLTGMISALATLTALTAGGTRGPLLGLVAGSVAYILLIRKCKHQTGPKYKPALLLLAFGAVIFSILFSLGDRIIATKEIASRAYYWTTALQMFPQNPLFGIGQGQFNNQFWNQITQQPSTIPEGSWYFILTKVVRGVQPGQLHNDHLQILVETGIVGAVLWLLLWTSVFYKIRITNSVNPHETHMKAAITGALIAVLVDAAFGFPFHLPCSGVLIWYLVGIISAWNPAHERQTSNKFATVSVKG